MQQLLQIIFARVFPIFAGMIPTCSQFRSCFFCFFSFYCAIVKSANIIFDVCVFTCRATLKINNFRGEYLVSGLIFFSEKYYIYRHISFIHFCTENVRFIYNFCYFLEGIISEKRSIRNQLYPLV